MMSTPSYSKNNVILVRYPFSDLSGSKARPAVIVNTLSGIDRSARLKLDRLESATTLKDLAALPGNRFEALIGDRRGQYSIRINDQWRICFEWPTRSPGPVNVEITDYH